MRVGCLFAGIGGFELAAEWMGWENVWSNEYDKHACKVLRKNFSHEIIEADIRDLMVDSNDNLSYIAENGDVIMGRKRLAKYDDAVTHYNAGFSIGDCAAFYDVTRQAMHKILIRRGCKFRSNSKGKDNHFHRGSEKTAKKKRTQHLAEKAVKKGILNNPGICSQCKSESTFRDGRTGIQAHHDDYDKPLDVRWLCQKCHYEWHKHNRALNETEKTDTEAIGGVDLIAGGFP